MTKVVRPYQRALEWVKTPLERRKKLSSSQASDWRSIADLGEMGKALDALNAPYYVVRWVAAPGRERPMREARFSAAVQALQQCRPWTNAAWRELQATTQPITGSEKRPAKTNRAQQCEEEEGFAALLALLDEKAA